MKNLLNLYDRSKHINYVTEILSGLTVSLALVPFRTQQRMIDMYVVPDVDHFDELNVLADQESTFFKKVCAMIGVERIDKWQS